jgi:hypothetical protein
VFSEVTIQLLTFEADSSLSTIEEKCLFRASLKSICISRSVEALAEQCFHLASIEICTFEPESRMKAFVKIVLAAADLDQSVPPTLLK